jgi:UMF1 family MFS transporter
MESIGSNLLKPTATHRTMESRYQMSKEERSWILYDVANSAFVLIMVTTIMPIFFKDVAAQGMDPAVSTANWGFANSLASLLLAAAAPILGTFADYPGAKKRYLTLFMAAGILFTVALVFVEAGQWLICLIFFVIAKVGFAGANIFYDAFLVDITTKARMDQVSAKGFAWGYVGSVVPFVMVIWLIMQSSGSTPLSVSATRISFIIVALWWLLFSIPILRNVHQTHHVPPAASPIKESFSRLAGTFKDLKRHKQAFLFLVAYFFYIDGVDTIIVMATSYGRDIGLGVSTLILAILMIQLVAFPFTLMYGRLAKKYSTRHMLYTGIVVYMIITVIGYFIPALPSLSQKTMVFWILAFLVATSMGGVQALSRSYFGKLIPAERSAEFFGFYNIFGKFAAITGPFLMGLTSHLTGDSRYGILSILLLLGLGLLLLKKAVKTP